MNSKSSAALSPRIHRGDIWSRLIEVMNSFDDPSTRHYIDIMYRPHLEGSFLRWALCLWGRSGWRNLESMSHPHSSLLTPKDRGPRPLRKPYYYRESWSCRPNRNHCVSPQRKVNWFYMLSRWSWKGMRAKEGEIWWYNRSFYSSLSTFSTEPSL